MDQLGQEDAESCQVAVSCVASQQTAACRARAVNAGDLALWAADCLLSLAGIACCLPHGRLSIRSGSTASFFHFWTGHRHPQSQSAHTELHANSTTASMTTLSASPASLAVMSPYDASEGPIHTTFYQPLHEPSSSTKGSPQTSPTDPPSSPPPPINTQTSDKNHIPTPSPQFLAPITEMGLSSSGLGFTPLNSTLASRVASMSQLEAACTTETALGKDVCEQYERSKRSAHDRTVSRRDRALSAPDRTVNLDLQNKPLRTEQPGAKIDSAQPITGNKAAPKPTAQEWASDLDCVSDVLGAMFADGDRGAR